MTRQRRTFSTEWAVRPLVLQSGGDLLGRPAHFEHESDDLKKLASWQQARSSPCLASALSRQGAGPNNIIAMVGAITFELTAQAADVAAQMPADCSEA